MSEHWDLDALADLEQGIADPSSAQAMQAHLDGCEDCRDRLRRVRTTRALLSALPADPAPPAVVSRLDAALASAALSGPSTVVPISGRRRWWRSPAAAGWAAAAAVVLLVTGLVIGGVARPGHHHDAAANTAGSADATAAARHQQAQAESIKEWSTGQNYTKTTIAQLVPRLVTGVPPAAAATGPGTGANVGQSPVQSPATVAGTEVLTLPELQASRTAVLTCGHILAGSLTVTPVAVDFARYLGRPAAVVVLPTSGHPGNVDVWVVRSVCSDQAIDLVFYRLDRPTG